MDTDLMEIVVNGESKLVAQNLTVSELLTTLEIASDRVAVELNNTIVRKRDWSKTAVPNASRLEIVQFVGGG